MVRALQTLPLFAVETYPECDENSRVSLISCRYQPS